MFRLSRRKGSTMWQVRKRWPSEVAPVLKGEFTKSTGEADRNKARATLPLIAAEYESKVQQARDRLADNRYRDLAEPEIARLTAQFYRTALPSYRIKRALSPAEAQAMLVEVQSRVSSTASSRRSPVSYFETNCRRLPISCAKAAWLIPRSIRASINR